MLSGLSPDLAAPACDDKKHVTPRPPSWWAYSVQIWMLSARWR